jgi:hypothetical protein
VIWILTLFFIFFRTDASCMWKDGVRCGAVRCAKCQQKSPMSFVPTTLFAESPPRQWSGYPETQTWYNCNISKWKRDRQQLDCVLQHIVAVEICMSYQCCSVHICEPHQILIQIQFQGWGSSYGSTWCTWAIRATCPPHGMKL